LQERNNNPNLPDETLPVPEEDFEPTNADEVEVIKRLQGQIVEKIRGERNGN